MNKVIEKAYEIMSKVDDYCDTVLPEVEIGDVCTISDVWDGEGNDPEGSYCYHISNSGQDGKSNHDVWIDYCWEIVEQKEDFLDTVIKVTNIRLI